MLAQTGDRWAAYYAPQERAQLSALLDGRYGGLGLWLRRSQRRRGLGGQRGPGLTGDHQGRRRRPDPGGRLLARRTAPASPRSSPSCAARPAVAGDAALRRHGATRHVRLTRADVTTPDVSVVAVNQHIEWIRISTFSRGVGAAVREGVAALGHKSAQGIILDLRGDPGGLLDEAVDVAGVFLDGGPVVSYSGRSMPTRVLDAPTRQRDQAAGRGPGRRWHRLGRRGRCGCAAGPPPRRDRRVPDLRQGFRAGTDHAVRRLRDRVDGRALPDSRMAARSTATA